MKILLTSSGGVIRGIENWPEYGLGRELVKLGHEVTAISSTSAMMKHDARRHEIIDGIDVRRFNPILPSSFFYVLREKFDLIHMHHLGYMAPISSYAAIANKFKKTPSVFTVHGIFHDPFLVKNVEDPFNDRIKGNIATKFSLLRLRNWFTHTPLNAQRITALTHWEKKELVGLGIDTKKINVVPNGVETSKFKKNCGNYFKKMGVHGEILLFVGQPTKRKGWQYLVEAMPEILKEFPDAKMVFVGYRSTGVIEELCKKNGVEHNAVFLGYLHEKEKIDAFKSADVFVFPTLYEGFGIIFLEAMAAGLPVVTTNSAGNGEIIKNMKNGILVEPKSSSQIAKAVIKLLNSKKLRRRLGKNGIKLANEFDWRNVVKKYTDVYEEVAV
jgi:glycosyltransferase involved in cell wall biosynthesis